MGGGNTVGEISGQASGDATRLGNMSIEAMAKRYQQLGLGGVGATPSGPTTNATPGIPGSGTTPTTPGSFTGGPTPVGGTPGGPGGAPFTGGGGSSGGGGASGDFAGGPTAFEMDIGALPSRTGGIPAEFQAALGEAQFQDLGQTASAAAGSAQAKGQTFSGIGSALGGLGGI